MNYKQIGELFDRIKNYYNMFTYNDDKVREWYKFLKEYDSDEVNKKLDEYVRGSHEQPPLVYALISGLQKIEEEPEKIYLMKCEYCEKPMYVGKDMTDFLDHERECMKIDFINRMSIKFRGKPIVMAKHYEMSKEQLDEEYHKVMNFYLQNKDNEKKDFLKEIPTE